MKIFKKIKNKLKEKKGVTLFIPTIIIFLSFAIFSLFFQKYFEIRFITENIRDTMLSESIQNIVSNYANTYHSARESYTSGHIPYQESFIEKYENTIWNELINELGLEVEENKALKIIQERILYSISNVSIIVENPKIRSGKNIYIKANVDVEIPIRIGFINIDYKPTISVGTKYITKF